MRFKGCKRHTVIYWLLILTTLFIFEKELHTLFANTIVGNIYFSLKESSDLIDTIIIIYSLFFVFLGVYLGLKKYVISCSFCLFYFIPFLYYLSFRLTPFERPELKYEFVDTGFIEYPYYDLLFYSFGLALILQFFISKGLTLFSKKSIQEDQQHLLEDNPVMLIDEDEYQFGNLAKNIANKIFEIPLNQRAFNIGIQGKWGSGKTSLINLIHECILIGKHNRTPKPIVIRYSPLMVNTNSDITTDFLLRLNDELKKFSSESNSLLKAYIFSLSKKISGFWNIIIRTLYGNDSYQSYANEIKRIIIKINRRIIIFIDDLDRLNKNEATNILRLIRNICDFPQIVFIVAYDKEYMCEKLQESGELKSAMFLEKFFTLEVEVPLVSNELLRKELTNTLKRNLLHLKQDLSKITNVFDTDYIVSTYIEEETISVRFIEHFIKNKRDLIRFINSLKLIPIEAFQKLRTDQIFVLELLRLKHYDLYLKLKFREIINTQNNQNQKKYVLNNIKVEKYQKEFSKNNDNWDHIQTALDILFKSDDEDLILNLFDNYNRFDLYFNYNFESSFDYNTVEAHRKNK